MRKRLPRLYPHGLSRILRGTWQSEIAPRPRARQERGPDRGTACSVGAQDKRESAMGLGKKAKNKVKKFEGKVKKDVGKVKHKGKKAKNSAKH